MTPQKQTEAVRSRLLQALLLLPGSGNDMPRVAELRNALTQDVYALAGSVDALHRVSIAEIENALETVSKRLVIVTVTAGQLYEELTTNRMGARPGRGPKRRKAGK